MSDSNSPSNNKQQQQPDTFFQQVADFTPELLFVIDLAKLEVIYINKKAEQLLGLKASFVYGQGHEIFKTVLHPDDYQPRMENLSFCQQLPDNKESEVEVRFKAADKSWKWFRIRDKVFSRKAGGTASHVIGIAQDIHEQKMADERLQEEHRRFKDAQTIGHIGSFERALPGERAICSEEFLRIHGLALHAPVISTQQFLALVHPEDQQAFLEAVNHTHATGEPLNVVNRIIRPDGRIRHVHRRSEILRNPQGSPVRVYGTIQDITEQVEAQEKKQASERLMREAETVGKFGSFKFLLSNTHCEASDGLYKLFGYEAGDVEFSLDFVDKVTLPEDVEKIKRVLEQARQDKQPFQYQRRIYLPNGQLRQLSISGKVVCDETGNANTFIGIVHDITELKKSAQTIQQMLHGSMAAISILESVRNEQGAIVDFIYRGGNKAAEKVLKKELQEMTGKSLLELWPGLRESLFPAYVQVVETGEPLRLEKYDPHEGFNHWFDISAVKNGDGFILTLLDISAQKKAEQEVIRVKDKLAQRATDKYLKLFNSIYEGFCIIEVIFDEQQQPLDFRYTDINPAFEQHTGLKNALHKTIRELVPDIESFWIETYGQVALNGKPAHFEHLVQPLGRWFEVKASRLGHPEDRQVAVLFNDVTERKCHERNLAFLAELQYDFTRLTEAEEIMQTVGSKMYKHFGLSRLTMSEVDEAADALTPLYEKQEAHLPETASETLRLSDFVNQDFKREFKARSIIALNDLSSDPRIAPKAEAHKALGAAAQLHASYIRQDLMCFIISLQKSTPYHWRPDETGLLQEIVTRLFLRLERARAEAALRKSEAKYRDLFNSIEQGFVVLEVILDENDAPVDYRVLEVNPRFEALTGISQEEALSGKTLREIRPDLEEKWFRYGHVVLTGEPLYLEEHSKALGNRWFGVNVYRTGGPEKYRLAVLYNDISERKLADKRIGQQNAVLEGINRIFREALGSQTEEELGRVCLQVVEEITGSSISFMGELNPTTGRLEDIAISDRSWRLFGVEDTSTPKKLLPAGLKIHGIYGRVLLDNKGFFTNDPSSHPDSIGTPKSHPRLDSFLGVPLNQEGKAIGMLGLANREGGYGPDELAMAEALAPAIVQALLRKRAEEALRKSEEQFRAIVDLVPDLLWSKNSKGVMDWYNRQWLEYTGQGFEEAIGYSWLNATHPDDRDNSMKAFQAAVSSGKMLRVEHRIRRHDGAYRWFLVQKRPVKDDTGKILRWYGSATDVHEERVATENLRHKEEQFRFMANNIPQIIWIADPDGQVEFINQVFLSYTGATKKPVNTKEMADFYVHPQDVPLTVKKWEEAMKNGKTFIMEHRIKSAQGKYRWFLVRAEPYYDSESGTIKHWFGSSTDIHDKKIFEDALIEAKEEAEKAASAKEEFLSTMSHEMRTPLNAVVGFTHLLLQQNPREDQKESLNGLSYSSRNLMNLINDILDFSKIEAGKVVLEENEFDLLDLMFSLKKSQQSAAKENDTELKLSLDDEIPELIICDRLKLSQVLHNLLGNAVKFTRKGVVSLEVNLIKQKEEYICLEFSVTDTGIGIAKEKIHHIFEKFSQADSSTIRHYGGTGLGLTITKKLLELMGSEIKVESQEGKGSRFYFTLPVKEGAGTISEDQQRKEPEEEKDFHQLRILLVEDVDLNRLIVKKFMEEWWNLLPEEAVNGKEAVEKAGHKAYDLILMDVRMPEMNGYEATRLIRGLAGKENTPIIALTADTGKDFKEKPEAAFFTDVITKPFDPTHLRSTILKYLPSKPKNRSPESRQGEGQSQANFQEVERHMNEDPEALKTFYTLTLENLKEYKKSFKDALKEKNLEKFGSMKHKATILMDTFRLTDLQAFLKETHKLLEKNPDENQLKKAQGEGEVLFDEKIKDIQAQLEKRFS